MSPLPTSFSAPIWSRMTQLWVAVETEKGDSERDVRLDEPLMTWTARPLDADDQVDADGPGHLASWWS